MEKLIDFAVVIGINAYRKDNGIKPLGTAKNDAREIAKLLKDEYKYQQVWELLDEQATREEITTLLTETVPAVMKKDDRLLFYFAGHGITRRGKDGSPAGYLIPQDAKIDDPATFLPMQELYDAFKAINCHHLLVILDCCYAGMFQWATRKLMPMPERIHREHFDRFTRFPAWQVLASAAHDQEALDLVSDQRQAIPGTGHSPFAMALLQGLRCVKEQQNMLGADYTGDGVITTPELYLYVSEFVAKDSKEQQTPGFWSLRSEYDRGEYIFHSPDFNPNTLSEAPPLDEHNNPYRGLKSFEERHARFFFGREAMVKELSDRLSQPSCPLTVVVGASGSGKSSLVQAGLIPYLREQQAANQQAQRWYILDPIRPGNAPFTVLARTLLPLEDSDLILKLDSIKYFDDVFKPKEELERSNHASIDPQSETAAQQPEIAFAKLADAWNSATSEAKLLVVADYLPQLKALRPSKELSELGQAIQDTINRLSHTLQQNPRALAEAIARWSHTNPNTKLLLVIDQFEELITMSSEPQKTSHSVPQSQGASPKPIVQRQSEQQQFLEVLRLTLATHRRRMHLILTLRSDFEPRFLESALKSHWRRSRFPVRAMNSDELRQAIEGPALKQALYFEPADLVGKLIDEVGQMPGALPLLSFTLSELYIKLRDRWVNKEATDRALKLEDYTELGGVAGSLTRRATEEYDQIGKDPELSEAGQGTMRRVMLRMVTIEGGGVARRRVPESELVYPHNEENRRRALVIDRLVKARLLVKGQETGEPYVEPAHDFLVRGWDLLQRWIKEDQKNLVLQRELTPTVNKWASSKQERQLYGLLWDGDPRLPLAKQLYEQNTSWFNAREFDFIRCSIQERYRRQNLLIGSGLGLGTVLSGITLFALLQLQLSILREKAAVARSLLETNPIDALVLAIQATGENRSRLPWQMITPVQSVLLNAVQVTRERVVFHANQRSVTSIAFSPDGKTIASGGYSDVTNSATIQMWDVQGNPIGQSIQTQGSVASIAFSPDGKIIASGGYSNVTNSATIWMWDVQGNPIGQPIQTQGSVASIAFSPDGKIIASGGYSDVTNSATIWMWDVQGNPIGQPIQTQGFVASIAFSPDGKMIVGEAYSGTIWVRDIQGNPIGQPIQTYMTSIAFSPDGKIIASGDGQGTIRMWNVQDNPAGQSIQTQGSVASIAFSPDGKMIAGGGAGTVQVWDMQGNPIGQPIQTQGSVTSIAFSPDGKIIASGDYSNVTNSATIRVWDVQGNPIGQSIQTQGFVTSIAFSPDGKIIASGDEQGTIRMWNVQGKLLGQPIQATQDSTTSITFSPDGKMIAGVSDFDQPTIRMWDMQGNLIGQPIQTQNYLFSIAFSSDGKMIAGGGADTVGLWDMQGNPIGQSIQTQGFVTSIAFSPDGKMIAGGGAGTVRVWDIQGNPIGQPIQAALGSVTLVAFNTDGKMVAGIGDIDEIEFWQIGNWQDWLEAGCEQLRYHSVSRNPQSEIQQQAKNTCQRYVWHYE